MSIQDDATQVAAICRQHCDRYSPDLDGVEVQISLVRAAGNAGGSTAAHADAVGGTPDLDHQPAQLWGCLLQMAVVDLTQTSTDQYTFSR